MFLRSNAGAQQTEHEIKEMSKEAFRLLEGSSGKEGPDQHSDDAQT